MIPLPPKTQSTPPTSSAIGGPSVTRSRRGKTLSYMTVLAFGSLCFASSAWSDCGGPATIQASNNCSSTHKEAVLTSGHDTCPSDKDHCVIAQLRSSRTVANYVYPPACVEEGYTYEAACIPK
jgi:hypothetical protein